MRAMFTRRSVWRALMTGFLALALLGSVTPVGFSGQAHAEPGDVQRTLTVGGKTITFLERYGIVSGTYDSRHHVFVVGTNNAIWHIWDTTNDGRLGPYSNWTSLGGFARSNVTPTNFTQSGALVLRISVIGRDGRRYCKWYNRPPALGRWSPGQLTWSTSCA